MGRLCETYKWAAIGRTTYLGFVSGPLFPFTPSITILLFFRKRLPLLRRTVNGVACIHMYLTAYETKGYTLEEMDDVFEVGYPAWKPRLRVSRLDDLEGKIRQGLVKVEVKCDEWT